MPRVEWTISRGLVAYPDALAAMEARVAAIRAGTMPEQVWLLEHPPLYTAGASARREELLEPLRLPVFPTGRGGRYTYHGPGQRVVYVMLDLSRRYGAQGPDLRAFVRDLEAWLIAALAHLGLHAERRDGRVGVWVPLGSGREAKIAAIGVRVRRWVSFHGASVNVNPDLSHYKGIIPCGVREHGVTSLAALGLDAGMTDLDRALEASFAEVFAPRPVPVPAG